MRSTTSLLSVLPFLVACQATTNRAGSGSTASVREVGEAPDGYAPARGGPEITDPAANVVREIVGLGEYPESSIPLLAAQGQPTEPAYARWTVRAWGGIVGRFVEDDNVTFQDPTFGTVELDWNGNTFGLGVDVERRFSKLLGLDLALGYTDLDIDFNHSVGAGVQTDSLGVIPIWLSLNFHVYDSGSVDVYLGPEIAYFFYLDDLSYNVPGVGTFNFQTDNEFPSLGLIIGTDVSLNDDWALNFAFRFQDSDADSNHDLPLDPTFLTVGVARSF